MEKDAKIFTNLQVGTVGSVILLVVFLVASIIVLMIKRSRKAQLDQRTPEILLATRFLPNSTTAIDLEHLSQSSYNTDSLELEFNNITELNLKQTNSSTCLMALFWENGTLPMNRCPENLPYDSSLVILKTNVQSCNYINATWIQNITLQSRYIVAQGPMSQTVEHFWQMVLDYKIQLIIMLTRTKENDPITGKFKNKTVFVQV